MLKIAQQARDSMRPSDDGRLRSFSQWVAFDALLRVFSLADLPRRESAKNWIALTRVSDHESRAPNPGERDGRPVRPPLWRSPRPNRPMISRAAAASSSTSADRPVMLWTSWQRIAPCHPFRLATCSLSWTWGLTTNRLPANQMPSLVQGRSWCQPVAIRSRAVGRRSRASYRESSYPRGFWRRAGGPIGQQPPLLRPPVPSHAPPRVAASRLNSLPVYVAILGSSL